MSGNAPGRQHYLKPPTSLLPAFATVAVLVVFQLGWHLLMNYFRVLRAFYLYFGSGPSTSTRRSSACLWDFFLPALGAGILLAWRAGPQKGVLRALFSVAVSVSLVALTWLYPRIASFEIWWLTGEHASPARALLAMAAMSFVLCHMGAGAKFDDRKKHRRIRRRPAS